MNLFRERVVICVLASALVGACAEPGALEVVAADPDGVAAERPAGSDILLAEAIEVNAESPTHRELTRRYSKEAAKGEAPVIVRDSNDNWTPEYWGGRTTEIEAPYFTKDAEKEGLNLNEAIRLAALNDIQTAESFERINRAEVAKFNAAFAYLPRVSAVGEYSVVNQEVISTDNDVFQEGSANFNVLNGRIEATQSIVDVSRLLGVRLATTSEAVAEAAYISAAQAAVFNTTSAYLTALEARARLDSVERRLTVLRAQSDAEGRRASAGVAAATARQLIEVELGRTEIEKLEYQADEVAAVNQLGNLIGQPVGDISDVELPARLVVDAGAKDVEAYVEAAVTSNPQMQQARMESLRQRQEFDRQLAADIAPTIELFGRAEYEDREASRFGGGSETFDATIGVRVNVPIFNASGQGYRSLEAESDTRLAILAESRIRRALETEVRLLTRQIASEKDIIAQSQSAAKTSKDLLAATEKGVRAGLNSRLDVLRQQIQYERAKEWEARARYA
ncbi:MAG: TolC family protein, partial [Pseudomonadota bacterium]